MTLSAAQRRSQQIEARELASEIADLHRRVRAMENQSQLARSSIVNGALQAHVNGQQTMIIGHQFDGTNFANPVYGPVPPTPTAALLTPALFSVVVEWDGLYEGGAIVPADFSRVEVHADTDPAFDALTSATIIGTIETPRGGKFQHPLRFTGPAPEFTVKFVVRTLSGNRSAPSAGATVTPLDTAVSDETLQDIADAMGFAAAANRVWRQDDQPTVDPARAFVIGDVWYDTNDGNRIRVWDGTTWADTRDTNIEQNASNAAAALTAAQNAATAAAEAQTDADAAAQAAIAAQTSANTANTAAGNALTFAQSRSKVYRQTSMPGTGVLGDVWYDTDDGNHVYVHNGTTYVDAKDAGIAAAAAAAAAAQSTATAATTSAANAMTYAQSRSKVYRQTTMPSSGVVGDTWFDTDDGNRIYVHNGTTFVDTTDLNLAAAAEAAQDAADSAQATAMAALGGAVDSVVNGSFEDDLTGWTATGDVTIGTTNPYEGAKYARLGPGAVLLWQPETGAEPDRVYRWGVRYRTSGTFTDGQVGIRPLRYPGGTNVPGFPNFTQATEWTHLSFEWTVTSGYSGITPFRVSGTVPASQFLEVDKAYCIDVTDIKNLEAAAAEAAAAAAAAQTAADNAAAAAAAAQATANAATTDAANAMAYAQTRSKVYRQTSMPGAGVLGDTWYDTDDGNRVYVHNGTTYVDAQDAGIAAGISAAAAAQSTASAATTAAANALTFAETRSKVYRQTAMPSTGVLGDTWFDTDDGNRVYVHNGTTYVDARDTGIGSAITAAAAAQTAANSALTAAQAAQAVADGAIRTYYQSTEPDLADWINYAANASFELNAASWTGTPVRTLLASGVPNAGDYVGRFTTTSTAALAPRTTTAVATTATETWTVVVWARNNVGTRTLRARLRFSDDTDTQIGVVEGSNVAAPSSGPFIALPVTGPAPAGATRVQAVAVATAGAVSDQFDVAAAMLVKGSTVPTVFWDGATPAGGGYSYAWIGAAYASASKRIPDTVLGDMWFDEDDGQAYRWTGSAWQIIEDSSIAVALAAAQGAQNTADGKISAFYLAAPPWANGTPGHDADVGDLWFDTDDLNKPYYWNGTAWTLVRDAGVSQAQTAAEEATAAAAAAQDDADAAALAAQNAQDEAEQAISNAAAALDAAEARSKVYRQTAMPSTGVLGDTWYDTDDGNKVYVHNGTTYVDTRDAGITAAMTSANGKNTVYRQDAQPPTTNRVLGDTWFETDQNNRIHVWTGSAWTLTELGTAAIANLSITNALIADSTIQNAKIANLDAAKITTGTLDAQRIGAQSITTTHLAVLGENRANDPGFESGTLNFHSIPANAAYDRAITTVAANIYSGTAALEHTAIGTGVAVSYISTNGGTAIATAPHPSILPGETAHFGGWVWVAPGATATIRATVTVRSRNDTATNVVTANSGYQTIAGTGWRYISTEVLVPPGTTATSLYYFGQLAVTGHSVGDVWRTDNMILRTRLSGALIVDGTIATQQLSATAIDGMTVTGATVQTVATAARGVKITSTGLTTYDGAGTPTFTLTGATGAIAMTGPVLTGGAVTGATVTGGTLQTEATAARGVKINSTGFTAYDGAGTPTFTITAATGALALLGPVLTGGTVTGATLQTETTASRGVKMTSGGLVGYDSTGAVKFNLTSAGALTLAGTVTTGGAIDGAVLTGGTIQTEATAARGIKLNSSGLVAYDGSGVATFTLTAATGAIAMTGPVLTGGALTGGTVTGGTVQTEATAARGVKITSAGLIGYDAAGVTKFSLSTTGVLNMTGPITSGGTIDGAVLTGGTVQTEATAARGIKINSTGLTAYTNAGVATFTLTAATGAIAMTGPVLTGGSVTGATLQTEVTAARGVKMTSTGIVGYDGTGVAKFTLTSAGALTLAGAIASGGTIDGAILTGGTVQTEATVARGVKINSTGLTAYDGSGVATFTLTAATGAIAMTGPVLTGGEVTGGTVTGGTVQTTATVARGVKITSAGLIGYDAAGVTKFSLSTTGVLSMAGALTTGGTIDGAIVTGGTIQTEATVARGIKMSSTGLNVYDGSGVATMTITASSGAVSMLGTLQSGSIITAPILTGGTIQTEATPARGIKVNSTGMTAYNGSGAATFTLTAATGGIAMTGPILTGGEVTGATLQTTATAARGIKMTSTALTGYDSVIGSPTLGQATFNIAAATGAVNVKGSITSGSTIDGAILTAGTVQTEATVNRGVKINSAGLVGYDSTGQATFTLLAATGTVQMKGDLLAGSTIKSDALLTNNVLATAITAADLTAVTMTGVTVQTRSAANRGVKAGYVNDTEGLFVFDDFGNAFLRAVPSEGMAVVAGEVRANSLTVSPLKPDDASSLGGLTEITRNPDGSAGVLRLTAYATPPKSAPLVNADYDTVQFRNDGEWFNRSPYGLAWDGGYYYTLRKEGTYYYWIERWRPERVVSMTLNGTTTVTAAAGTFAATDVGTWITGPGIAPNAFISAYVSSTQVTISVPATTSGAATLTISPTRVATSTRQIGAIPGAIAAGGGFVYVLYSDNVLGWFVDQYDSTTLAFQQVNEWTHVDNWNDSPAMTWDSAAGNLIIAQSRRSNADKVRIRRYTITAGSGRPALTNVGSLIDTDEGYAQDLADLWYGTADLGAARYVLTSATASHAIRVVNATTGNFQPGYYWPSGMSANKVGLTHNGTEFVSLDETGWLRRYTGITTSVDADPNMTKWVSNTLLRPDREVEVTTTNLSTTVTAGTGLFAAADVGSPISGAGIPVGATIATYVNSGQVTISAAATATGPRTVIISREMETSQSPRFKIAMPKRTRLNVSTSALNTGGTNSPDRVRVYVGQGAADPGRTMMRRQADPVVGATSVNYTTLLAPVLNTGNPPASNGFSISGGTVQRLEKADGSLIIDGLGRGVFQAGQVNSGTIAADTTKDVAVVFPTPYPAPPAVVANPIDLTTNPNGAIAWAADITTTGFILRFRRGNTSSFNAQWIATPIS